MTMLSLCAMALLACVSGSALDLPDDNDTLYALMLPSNCTDDDMTAIAPFLVKTPVFEDVGTGRFCVFMLSGPREKVDAIVAAIKWSSQPIVELDNDFLHDAELDDADDDAVDGVPLEKEDMPLEHDEDDEEDMHMGGNVENYDAIREYVKEGTVSH
uniref:Subtilisin n=1 Tax=Alexandrium catenella TaxID=2925 RepID=A0A7S1S348_ALECA